MTMDQPRIAGALVISLDWDTEADLDLHVQLPSDGDAGVNEIWSRKPSGLPFGSAGASVDSGMQAGYLDFDSNSMCVIDGRREENVIFPYRGSQRTLHRARRHLLTVRRDHRALAG
jgi:hypothetical protein